MTDVSELRRVVAECLRPGRFFARGVELRFEHEPNATISWEIFQGRLLDPAHTRQTATFESWHVFLDATLDPASGGDLVLDKASGGREPPGTRVAHAMNPTAIHVPVVASTVQGANAPRSPVEEVARDVPRSPNAMGAPVLSVHFDAPAARLHVVRSILCYAHEGYDAGDNVYLTREVQKWLCELVATIDLPHTPDLASTLSGHLFHAVVGTSRLPLTSLEAPLPAFVLGQFGYIPGSTGEAPIRAPRELVSPTRQRGSSLHPSLARRANDSAAPSLELTKRVELMLRSVAEADLPDAVDAFRAQGLTPAQTLALLRLLFDEVSLSPWTQFVPRTLAFVGELARTSVISHEQHLDFLSYLLRQLARHLTAYDLVTFHHQGANYPDALLLDAALQDYLTCIEAMPGLLAGEDKAARRRRRALRQAVVLRGFYEGHLVPDAPTSPGENARVLPAPHVRVPEEQFLMPHRRSKRLYEGRQLAGLLQPVHRELLRRALDDLADADELRELGVGLFLDRPLGVFKAATEPDDTLLFSYEAYSPSIALRRLRVLAARLELIDDAEHAGLIAAIEALPQVGVALPGLQPATRPGAVSLGDTLRVADDFRILRTTRRSARAFFEQYDFEPAIEQFGLDFLHDDSLIARGKEAGELTVYDAAWRPRLELRLQPDGDLLLAVVRDEAGTPRPIGTIVRSQTSSRYSGGTASTSQTPFCEQ